MSSQQLVCCVGNAWSPSKFKLFTWEQKHPEGSHSTNVKHVVYLIGPLSSWWWNKTPGQEKTLVSSMKKIMIGVCHAPKRDLMSRRGLKYGQIQLQCLLSEQCKRSQPYTNYFGQILWANQPNEKTATEKQAEGSLTLPEERPKTEAIRVADQNNGIDLAGEQAARSFKENLVLQQVTKAALAQCWSTIWWRKSRKVFCRSHMVH